MNAITRLAAGETSDTSTRIRFRKTPGERPSKEEVGRAAEITLLAFRLFSCRTHALQFLNSHNDDLGERVIDLAARDPAGLASAIAHLGRSNPMPANVCAENMQ